MAGVAVIGFVTVAVPNPNEGKVPAAVTVGPNVTFVAGFANDVKPNAVVVVAVVGPNVGSVGCWLVVADKPKLPKAGG